MCNILKRLIKMTNHKKSKTLTIKIKHLVILFVLLIAFYFIFVKSPAIQETKDIVAVDEKSIIKEKLSKDNTPIKRKIINVNKESTETTTMLDNALQSVITITGSREDNVLGSGFIFSKDGYVITTYQVIKSKDSRRTFKAMDYNKKSYKLIQIGRDTKNDIAVLKIENEDFVPLPFADSSKVKVGDQIFAIGNPFGAFGDKALTYSVTEGIVSQVDRFVSEEFPLMIQNDVPVSPGSGGSPLINKDGEFIGIVSLKLVGIATEGIGFAIPSNTVKIIVENIIEKYTPQKKEIVKQSK